MEIMNRPSGNYATDIIITSKSALEGSNRNVRDMLDLNLAPLGCSKFHKELVEDCTKVNTVCPGNFFDGRSGPIPPPVFSFNTSKVEKCP